MTLLSNFQQGCLHPRQWQLVNYNRRENFIILKYFIYIYIFISIIVKKLLLIIKLKNKLLSAKNVIACRVE